MATSEALTKYYDCLKDSFNKLQLKENKTALINAALRPKIRDEFAKSKDVLISYLNYIQESPIEHVDPGGRNVASLVHNTVKEILRAKPELIEEYTHNVIRLFPNIYSDGHDTFINYLGNSLEICTYIRGEPLTNLIARILDKINPPSKNLGTDEEELVETRKLIEKSYDILHDKLNVLEERQLENVSAAILAAFTREFLTSHNENSLNFLILYICSTSVELLDLFINLLWATYTNSERPSEERRASVCYACSFMSRANYVGIDKVLNYLETATIWCKDFDHDNRSDNELFYALIRSILYLITQRYREMYEVESIDRLKKMDLDSILESPLKPLDHCDNETEQRFREVATLYGISSLRPIEDRTPTRKKRKSLVESGARQPFWKVPFKENDCSIPVRVRMLYRNYYDHRNFTVYRE